MWCAAGKSSPWPSVARCVHDVSAASGWSCSTCPVDSQTYAEGPTAAASQTLSPSSKADGWDAGKGDTHRSCTSCFRDVWKTPNTRVASGWVTAPAHGLGGGVRMSWELEGLGRGVCASSKIRLTSMGLRTNRLSSEAQSSQTLMTPAEWPRTRASSPAKNSTMSTSRSAIFCCRSSSRTLRRMETGTPRQACHRRSCNSQTLRQGTPGLGASTKPSVYLQALAASFQIEGVQIRPRSLQHAHAR
mmetsp:Transcript_64802/g.200635  ORF Transcript_64802/g.200635 Transcript_64802/m.200635 type:complete len:245 (-) Transcript_64802:110-844(-)